MKKFLILILALGAVLTLPSQADEENFVWSANFVLKTQDHSTPSNPLHINGTEAFPYSSDWISSYEERQVGVTVTVPGQSNPEVIVPDEVESKGTFSWEYLAPSITTHTLTHNIKDGNGRVLDTLICYITTTYDGYMFWGTNFGLDTLNIAEGKTIELLPTDKITYSTQWVFSYDKDRKITITATSNGESHTSSILDVATPYEVYTSDVEGEGQYVWDYSHVSPEVLPRDEVYTLTYNIHNNSTSLDIQDAEVKVTLVPEPTLVLGLALLVLGVLRKR